MGEGKNKGIRSGRIHQKTRTKRKGGGKSGTNSGEEGKITGEGREKTVRRRALGGGGGGAGGGGGGGEVGVGGWGGGGWGVSLGLTLS